MLKKKESALLIAILLFLLLLLRLVQLLVRLEMMMALNGPVAGLPAVASAGVASAELASMS